MRFVKPTVAFVFIFALGIFCTLACGFKYGTPYFGTGVVITSGFALFAAFVTLMPYP